MVKQNGKGKIILGQRRDKKIRESKAGKFTNFISTNLVVFDSF